VTSKKRQARQAPCVKHSMERNMRERIEEFTRNGKNFMYIDISNLKKNEDYTKIVELVQEIVVKYAHQSVYTIVNIENILFDTETKEIAAGCLKHNEPYVRCGAVIGLVGMKKIMANAAIKISGRKNMQFFYTREKAIEWLLQQE
jgi:hypothetical protein